MAVRIWRRNFGSWLRASAFSSTRSVTTLVAAPAGDHADVAGAAIRLPFVRRPTSRRFADSAMASPAIVIALTPCSGACRRGWPDPDFDRHAERAGRADGELVGRAAVPVERQRGEPNRRQIGEVGAVQADFLLHRPEEHQRRVRQFASHDLQGRGQNDGASRPIVGAQARSFVGRARPNSPHHRLRADAQGHGVEWAMSSRRGPRTCRACGRSGCPPRRRGACAGGPCRCEWPKARRPRREVARSQTSAPRLLGRCAREWPSVPAPARARRDDRARRRAVAGNDAFAPAWLHCVSFF